MKNKRLNAVAVISMSALLAMITGCSRNAPESVHASDHAESLIPRPNVVLASPGRIEGRTETIPIGAGADGVIKQVFVSDGQQVKRGQKLAEIDCPDLQASLQASIAEEESARQTKERVLRGSRDEERLAAEQRTAAAKAVLEESASRLKRLQPLRDKGVISAIDFDQAQRDYDVADAKLREAHRTEDLVKAKALDEDIRKADADIQAADYRKKALEDKIGKCQVTAPMNGTILKVLMKAGEAYSTLAPQPLFTMADLSIRRVRAEVDERDVMKVHVGQKALISTEADQDDRYEGVVESISTAMGRKHTQSGDPAEKADRDILETMVRLDGSVKLPVGMRVIVKFESPSEPDASKNESPGGVHSTRNRVSKKRVPVS